jgi:hypothetical protein
MSSYSRFFTALALALALVVAPTASFAGVFIGVGIGITANFAPPPLPVYVQPPCPVVDDLWVPGYWAYAPGGYYWVPGTWVAAPQPGYLWTPGYWGFAGGVYGWHGGYWGPHVGFYGGVNYGFGYGGIGYAGGGWAGGHFQYNTAVTNVNTTVINNVYVNRTVVNNYNGTSAGNVSYNGGPGGITAHPSPEEEAAANESHLPPTATQRQHVAIASRDRNSFASYNGGNPRNGAVATPLSRENKPEGYVPMKTESRAQNGQGMDAFSRGTTTNADRFDSSDGTRADTYRPSYAGRPATTYHPAAKAPHRSFHAAPPRSKDK